MGAPPARNRMGELRRPRARRTCKPCCVPALPLAVVLAVLPAGVARAQLIDRYFPANIPAYQDWTANLDTTGVGDEQPTGVRTGGFIIQPTIDESFGYDSNPAGKPSGPSTPTLVSSGSVTATSDWSRNALGAALTYNDTRYLDQPALSFTTWSAAAGGAIEYGDDEIRLGYIHVNSVTLPTDTGTFGITAPITNAVDDVRVSDTIGPGPLTVEPALVGELYRFSANAADAGAPGAMATSLNLPNRDVVTPSLTVGYDFAGGHNLLLVLNDEYVTYPNGNAASGTPNYNDASVLVGIEYRQSALFVYRALVGYEDRFQQGNSKNGGSIATPNAELDAIWTPTTLMSLTARLSRSLQDEATVSGQGLKETSAQLSFKYAIRRNVMLESFVRYQHTSATTGQPAEETYAAGADASWRISRRLSLSLSYDFTRGEDGGNLAGFTRNQVFLQASFKL
jgi:hypothetical protein